MNAYSALAAAAVAVEAAAWAHPRIPRPLPSDLW